MLFFSVLLLVCCVFVLHREGYRSEALIIYNPRSRYYVAGGYYGGYYNQNRFQFNYSPEKSSQKQTTSNKRKVKSQPPVNVSFEPLGALKMDSLTHGQIEINPDKIDDILMGLALGTLSLVPDLYQYLPSWPSWYGNDNEPENPSSENQSADRSRKHHQSNDENDGYGNEDNSETGSKQDHSDDNKNDDEDHDEKDEDGDEDNAAEEHDDDNKSEPKNHSKNESDEGSQHDENKSKSKSESEHNKNSKEPETGTEVPIETPMVPQEGYIDKFVKYYSYAKPLAKAASLFVPGLGQYRAVMLGAEMADLAYNVASMYSNGDGYLSMGYFLGKEAFKRLGRRSDEPSVSMSQDSKIVTTITTSSSSDVQDFIDKVQNTKYPALDDEKELKIRTEVANIVHKYCHDQEEYQNEVKRTKFIDLMVSSVKFIALHEIIPASNNT